MKKGRKMYKTVDELSRGINSETERIKEIMKNDTSVRIMRDMNDALTYSLPSLYISSSGKSRKITDVNVIVPNKVVEVTFLDGDKQKAVCQEPDVFSLEQAISICLAKHLLGGTGAYNKAVKNGIKVYKEEQKEKWRIKFEEERIAKRRAKKMAYMKRRAEKRREEQIEIQKEAYVRALKEVNSKMS